MAACRGWLLRWWREKRGRRELEECGEEPEREEGEGMGVRGRERERESMCV